MSRLPFALATILSVSAAQPAFAQDEALADGREATETFLAGDLDPLWDRMTPDMQAALGSLDAFSAFRDEIEAQLGEEDAILEETADTQDSLDLYTRISRWTASDIPVVTQWAFDTDNMIAGFVVQPQQQAAPSDFLDYETGADLRLPFDGEWFVFWGGHDIEDNYHAANPAQRFAYDFVVHRNGQSYAGDPELLESYHCWGREILAPADGQVIATVTDLPDQMIGQTDAENPAGNHVILSVGEEEFLFLAHLQQGSITVQQGQEIAQGDVVGLCGNSGNTSEPHLHLHLQNTPDLLNGAGLPAQFQNYTADGEEVAQGEPVRGELVAPAP